MTTTSDPKALQLDGQSGFGALASAQALGLYDADFTVEAWVRIDAWGTTDILPILGTAATATRQGLHLAVRNRRPYLGFYEADTAGSSELALATWYHLAWRFTRATGEQTIFLNGVPDGSSTGNGAFLGTETVWIGRYADEHLFRGEIAELRIWRSARTAAEILDHMHRRLSGDEPDLVGVWPLDDGAGTSAANRKTRHPGRAPHGLAGRPLSVFEGQPEEQAVELDGDGSWIEIPHAADLHFVEPGQDFTVELQERADPEQSGSESERVVLEKWTGGGGFPYALRYRPGDGRFVFARSSGTTPHPEIVSAGAFADGCFHHLAAVREGPVLRLYVDGELAGETADPITSTIRGTSPLYLGGRARRSHFLNGSWSELRLWRRARSEAEIRAGMTVRLAGDEADLAGYWPLDATDVAAAAAEDLEVRSGLIRPAGALTAAAWTAAAGLPILAAGDDALVAPALEFDGEQSAATVPAAASLAAPAALTVEAWVRPAVTGRRAFLAPVVSRGDAVNGWELYASDRELAFLVTVDGVRHQVSRTPAAAAERWLHLAGVYDGSRLELHVNGVPAAGLALSGELTPASGALCLGRSAYWAERRFAGQLAEVRVWSLARGAGEIQGHLFRRLSGGEAGLVGYWPLSEGAGESLAHPGDDALTATAAHVVWRAAELPPRLEPGEVATVDPAHLVATLEARLAARTEELRAAVEQQEYIAKSKAELNARIAGVDLAWTEEKEQIRIGLEGEIAELEGELEALDAAQRESDSAVVDALLDDLVRDIHQQIERARLELKYEDGDYNLGRVSVELKYLAGAGGRGALFPGLETDVGGERLSVLNLDFATAEALAAGGVTTGTVPSVLGMTALPAERKLKQAGFRAEVCAQSVTSPAQAGRVVSQLPAALTEAEPSTTVRVFLGKASG